MEIKLLKLDIENFKGCNKATIDFADNTSICGANATGKTTVFDAFTWLLFNRDSLGNTKFDIRPLDKNGNIVNNVVIMVEATVSVKDGEDVTEYTLKKSQKQLWRKKRGTGVTEFQGNVNEFEVNGYPKTEKEFKDFINNIIKEDVFKLITDPNAFNLLPWKEQREILVRFIGEISDVKIAEQFGEKYGKLIPELKIASTDDIMKKYTKVRNTLNKQMDEIPSRIDEVSKQLVIVDVGALEVEKSAKEMQLSRLQDELQGGADKQLEISKLQNDIMNFKFELSAIQNRANEELDKKRSDARKEVYDIEQKVIELKQCIRRLEFDSDNSHKMAVQKEQEKQSLLARWKSVKESKFIEFEPLHDFVEPEPLKESDFICPTCGQDLPTEVKQERLEEHQKRCERLRKEYEEKVSKHQYDYEIEKSEFDKKRERELELIKEQGQKVSEELRNHLESRKRELLGIERFKKEVTELEKELDVANKELESIPKVADITGNANYLSINRKITECERKIEELSKDNPKQEEILYSMESLKKEINEIELKILASDNTKVKERIAELEEEQKQVGQKIAEQEQMIDLVEDFIKAKMNIISEQINGKFETVSFILFETQINGGIKETCECMVNGVPYSSLNNGMRICAGLDIIKSLSKLYNVTCPIFVDNAESVNDFNLPNMESQMVLLKVTEDSELKVESEVI